MRFFHLFCKKGGAKKLYTMFFALASIAKDGDTVRKLVFGVFFGRKSSDPTYRRLSIFCGSFVNDPYNWTICTTVGAIHESPEKQKITHKLNL